VAAASLAFVVLAAVITGCSSNGDDQVVAGGPAGTATPPTPAVDNPTTSALTTSSSVSSSTSTTDPDVAATTATTEPTTTVTSVAPATTVPADAYADGSLTMQLFWVRPPDDPRTLDLPGYRDPESGPKPLVVYGSATNNGTDTVMAPGAVALFRDDAGNVLAVYGTQVLLPGSTTPAASLAPGESGDVIFVIEGASGEQLAAAVAELRGGSGA
jgi:hypothetical protein